MKFRLTAFAICLFASGASAATLEELQSVRDAALAGECSELTRFQTHQVEHGELYQLPCRTTATGQMDVFVQKTSRQLPGHTVIRPTGFAQLHRKLVVILRGIDHQVRRALWLRLWERQFKLFDNLDQRAGAQGIYRLAR